MTFYLTLINALIIIFAFKSEGHGAVSRQWNTTKTEISYSTNIFENTTECIADIQNIAFKCGPCNQGNVVFNGDADRCTCDNSTSGKVDQACNLVLSSGIKSVLLHPKPPYWLGFTTQINDIAHHIAAACLTKSHLLYGGFKLDALNRSSPLVPLDTLLSIDNINFWLSKLEKCTETRLLPWHCAAHFSELIFSREMCTRHLYMKERTKPVRDFGAKLQGSLPLDLTLAAAAAHSRSSQDFKEGYNSVHFNLDCEWLLYLERLMVNRGIPGFTNHFDHYIKDPAKSQYLCVKGYDRAITTVAELYVDGYVNATRQMGSHLPIFLATSIGKQGHNTTTWVINEYKNKLGPTFSFFESLARSPHREINAAAELGLVLGARNFVGIGMSTFSKLVAGRIRRRHNQSNHVFMISELIVPSLFAI